MGRRVISPLEGLPFHQRMKQERISAGLTQEQCATAAGVDDDLWGAWERGIRQIKVEKVDRIAAALGVTRARLFGEQAIVLGQALEHMRNGERDRWGGNRTSESSV